MALTDEQAAELAAKLTPDDLRELGVDSVEEAVKLIRNMDTSDIQGRAQGVLNEEEELLAEAVAAAHSYIDGNPDSRVTALSHWYVESKDALPKDATGQTNYGDIERLFLLLSMATFQLAEAENIIASLQDGGHRTSGTPNR